MMELPNFSRQLLQQLGLLRNEGLFCDCTILVGDSHHRAHKVVLAASSMLFRSLLDSSDTISIDTTVVSTQEFGCLLDMIYTGKLPLGKHNVSRVVAAAESLQMFDLAVGFKNVLTTLVNQQADTPNISVQTSSHATISSVSTVNPEGSASPSNGDSTSNKMETSDEIKKRKSCDFVEDDEMEPACKRTCQEPSDSSGLEEAKSSGCVAKEIGSSTAKVSGEPAGALLQHASQVVELLSNMSSVLELLSQAAQSSLDELDRQVEQIVCECCEGMDPSSGLEQLMSRLRDGMISERVLLQLLRAVEQKAPSSFPARLQSLLEDMEKGTHQAEVDSKQQDDIRNEEKPEQEVDDSKERTEEKDEKSTNTTAESSPSASSHSKSYVCCWCKKSFEYKCRMLAHMKRCSMSRECELQCPHCPEKLASQRAMRRHLNEVHRNTVRVKKKVACDLCGRTFAHPSGLVYHRQTEHFEEKPFACKECGTKFAANSSLKNHMRLHTGEKPYHCQHCDISFTVAAALSYHTKKKHSEGKMYVCQYCKAVFAQSIELTRHVRTHTGDRPYVCRECGKGYSQASGLTVHLQTFHNLSEPHDCKKCCLSFSSLEKHQQHIQEFHPKEFHKCSTCNKVFPSSVLLDKHKATHTGTKPFSCQLCNKSYQQLSGLWYHNRTNHPEVFASQTQQLSTLLQCDLCFKFFPSTASLAKHHAAEHQASASSAVCCLYCKAELDSSEKLQEHICSQHISQSGEAFSCPLCSLICVSQLELQEHLLSFHTETQQEQENGTKEQASTSYTVISADSVVDKEDEHKLNMVPKKKSQLEASPHVFVALTSGESRSSGEVLEVNMYDLLNRSVTFIYENPVTSPDS